LYITSGVFLERIILYNFLLLRSSKALVRSLQCVLVHIGECRLDSGLEKYHVGMSLLVGHSFNDAPHVIVHRIQIWTVWRPEFFETKHFYIIRQPVLNLEEHLSNSYHIGFESSCINSTYYSVTHIQSFC